MSNENKMKIKAIWKKWQIAFGLFGIFLLAIVASGCGGESTTENKQENQSTTEVEKTQQAETQEKEQ
jgi:hypothetical protein